jgi:hypothetical protein
MHAVIVSFSSRGQSDESKTGRTHLLNLSVGKSIRVGRVELKGFYSPPVHAYLKFRFLSTA